MSIAQDLVLKLGDFYQNTMAAIGRSDPMTLIILATLTAVLAILVFMGCPICLRWFLGRQAEVPQGPQATQPPTNPNDVEAGGLNDNEGRPPTPQGPPAPQRDAHAPGQYNLEDQYRVLAWTANMCVALLGLRQGAKWVAFRFGSRQLRCLSVFAWIFVDERNRPNQ